MDFSICYTECITTFLYALLNGPIVNPKIVYNQPLLILLDCLLVKKDDSMKVLNAIIKKVLNAIIKTWLCKNLKYIFFILYIFTKKVSLYFSYFCWKTL